MITRSIEDLSYEITILIDQLKRRLKEAPTTRTVSILTTKSKQDMVKMLEDESNQLFSNKENVLFPDEFRVKLEVLLECTNEFIDLWDNQG